jgi:hypothetical protein
MFCSFKGLLLRAELWLPWLNEITLLSFSFDDCAGLVITRFGSGCSVLLTKGSPTYILAVTDRNRGWENTWRFTDC